MDPAYQLGILLIGCSTSPSMDKTLCGYDLHNCVSRGDHGVSEQEAIKRGPDTTAQIGSKFGRHTREMSTKVRPHLSVGKLIEISSKDNTRVGNMGEVRD